MENAMDPKIGTVIELMKQTTIGPCAIAIVGAHAKGTADASSDIDIYLFADAFKPQEERRHMISTIADTDAPIWISHAAEDAPWGGSMDLRLQGTPIETTFRTFEMLDHVVEECLAGRFQIVPATWTSNGYYTFIYLSELSFMRPVWDPLGRLAAYQQKVRDYPPVLRQSILSTFMARANTWLDNFHYDSAIRRRDILFTAPIVLHTLLDMVQVIFALNCVYFTGDKKLEKALAGMPLCPSILKDELRSLLDADQDIAGLSRQRDILRLAREELQQYIQQDTARL